MRVLYRRIIIFTFIFHVCCQNQDEGLHLRKSAEASLKILAIGNSFTEDGTAYLPALLNDKKLSHKVEMAQLIRGASSLAMH
ncbi:MAG: hypothetical protein LBD45_01150, partial [Bacteroidales bacterium]|nr:hypothetical protein [Bacteroidales bacterium]